MVGQGGREADWGEGLVLFILFKKIYILNLKFLIIILLIFSFN